MKVNNNENQRGHVSNMPSNGAVAVELAVGWTLFLTILKTSRADSECAFMLSNTVEKHKSQVFFFHLLSFKLAVFLHLVYVLTCTIDRQEFSHFFLSPFYLLPSPFDFHVMTTICVTDSLETSRLGFFVLKNDSETVTIWTIIIQQLTSCSC